MVGMKFEKIKAVIDIFVDDNEISIGMTLKYRLRALGGDPSTVRSKRTITTDRIANDKILEFHALPLVGHLTMIWASR